MSTTRLRPQGSARWNTACSQSSLASLKFQRYCRLSCMTRFVRLARLGGDSAGVEASATPPAAKPFIELHDATVRRERAVLPAPKWGQALLAAPTGFEPVSRP